MALKLDETGKAPPPRIVLYGVPGIGKSTAAASMPSPIMIPTEAGLDYIQVPKVPLCSNFGAVISALESLLVEEHQYKTVCIDTLDGLEALAWAQVCREGGKSSIEEFGFGKGYVLALDKFNQVLAALDKLRTMKGMLVLLTCHSMVKLHNAPDNVPFDRYQFRLNDKAASIVKAWCDVILFANYKVVVDTTTGKAYGGEERVCYSEERPAHWGKNRLKLPYELEFVENKFWDTFKSNVNKKGQTK